jgi:hypothetical protein
MAPNFSDACSCVGGAGGATRPMYRRAFTKPGPMVDILGGLSAS